MSTTTDMQPFSVVKGKYLFWFTPAEEGGFGVTCQNLPGVNAQGDTFEEAVADAMKCAALVEKWNREDAELKPRTRRAACGKNGGNTPTERTKAPQKAVVRPRKRN